MSPVPHFVAGLASPTIHTPVFAGFAPAAAVPPASVTPLTLTTAVAHPVMQVVHPAAPSVAAPVMPQMVPIAATAPSPIGKYFSLKYFFSVKT